MSGAVDRLLGLPGWLVLLVTGLVVFCEDALFIGFVLPGETVALLAGVTARLGHVSLAAVLVVVVLAAVAGDSVGYELGRHAGARVLKLRALDRHQERLEAARSLLARRGGSAVFLGRWVAFFRAVMPALAGMARMPYLRFLGVNAAGGLAWGTVVVLAGYAAGASYGQVQHALGHYAAVAVLGLVLVGVLTWRIRRRIHRRRAVDPHTAP